MTTGRRRTERGAALLVVMVAVAVLTALAVDLAYESRVSLRIAANARDELRAVHRARSGVALSRLVLSFQQTVDQAMPAVQGLPIPRVQIWKMVPVGSELASGLFGGEPSAPAAAAIRPASAYGAPPGEAPAAQEGAPHEAAAPAGDGFVAVIEDEGRKVNAQLDGLVQTSKTLGPQVQALNQLICDARWDPLFEREDEHGVRTSREDVLVHLRDWVDDLSETSALQAAFGATSCETVVQPVSFNDAFGDENQPYDRGEDRYRTKNARMDSLDELYLVAGIGDAFMAAFGDALTIYLPRDAQPNVNDTSREGLLRNARLIAYPPGQPMLLDPVFAERLQQLVLERTFGGILAIPRDLFGQLVQAAGVEVNPAALGMFADSSNTFRIRATGAAGDVRKAIDAVVRVEPPQPGQPVAAPGRLVHWREE